MPRRLLTACAALGLLLTGGCNWYYNTLPSPDDLMHAIPWFDHMIVQPSVHPYQFADVPRDTPEGTVPVTGGERDWGTGNPWMLQYAFDTLVADRLPNPTDKAATLARGDTLFHTFCSVCHGPAGDPAAATVGPRLGALSLLTPRAKTFKDGYLYSMIRYGRGLMPRYGDKIRPDDRWAIVNYVRTLQAASADTGHAGGKN